MRTEKMLRKIVSALICLTLVFALMPASVAEELPTPSLNGANASGSGIRVSWNAVDGADGYRVYRKSGSLNWSAVANNVSGTSYQDNSAEADTTYTYTVRCLKGGELASGFSGGGVSASWTKSSGNLSTPKMKSAQANGSGILVSWEGVSGAEGYRVYRKSGSGKWASIANNVTGTSYQDNSAEAGKTYVYTVRCLKDGKLVSGFDSKGVSGSRGSSSSGALAAPNLISASGEKNGIRVKWEGVSGADGYRVYRKESGTGWSAIANLGDTGEYLDGSAAAGKTYVYTVRCTKGGNAVSGFDSKGVSAKRPGSAAPSGAPQLKSATSESGGIRIGWGTVSGYSSYRVYRKTSNSGWTALATVSATSYLDTTALTGTEYTYTVRCVDGSGKAAGPFDANGVTASRTSGGGGTSSKVPALKSISFTANSLVVKWNEVAGAAAYRVYRKVNGSQWAAVGQVSDASYVDTSVSSGNKYTYTVRTLDASGKTTSGFDAAGISATFYAAPVMVSVTSGSNGLQVKWNAVTGAQRYIIWRKPVGGKFARLGTVQGTTFEDTNLDINTTYVYTVAVIAEDGKTILSEHQSGIEGKYVGRAAISGLSNDLNGVTVSWNGIVGASSYKLYRKFGAGGWMELATTSGTSYLDTSALNNTTYTYYVRALDASGNFAGTYDAAGRSITYYVAPTLEDCYQSGDSLITSWEAVSGISNYAVLRKVDSGSWMLLGYSSTTSYVDRSVPSGTWCLYTVRCAAADGTFLSTYDPAGIGLTSYVDYPVLTGATALTSSILVTWDSVDKATNYQVYRKTGARSAWIPVAIVSTPYYYDSDIANSNTYFYTVAVCDSYGNDLSDYNDSGVSATYYQPPVMSPAKNDATGVTVSWQAVDGIGSYRVYRKTGSGTWTPVGTSSTTSFTDTGVVTGGHYWYTASCLNNSAEVSVYDATGVSTVYYEAPAMTGASNVANGIKVTWNPVDGIGTYSVYRKVSGGSWEKIATVSDTSYTDTSAASGKTYTYTARCVKGGSEVSYFNTTRTATRLAAPSVSAVSSTTGKVKVTWSAAGGATQYEVFRKIGTGSYEKVYTASSAGSIEQSITSNSTVYYYVDAVNGSVRNSSAVQTVTVK